MNLLITAGATREPIDDVRFLSNVSTGSTGAALATLLAAKGHQITLLRGAAAVVPTSDAVEQEVFSSAHDLSDRLRVRLAGGKYHAVIMCAAVSDYRAADAASGKISSELEQLSLTLVRNQKILPALKTFSPQPLFVIGFKLTVDADDETRRSAVSRQFAAGGVDAVVHNDLSQIRAAAPQLDVAGVADPGPTREAHRFNLFPSSSANPESLIGVTALASALDRLLAGAEKDAHPSA